MPELLSISDLLYWAYANEVMAERAVYDHAAAYEQLHFIIRNRIWSGLRKGTMKVGTLVKDARIRMRLDEVCSYCGETGRMAADHLIPKAIGGTESADNILWACRRCNSSKADRDVLEWFKGRSIFPPLLVIRVYLKLAVRYCQMEKLLDIPLVVAPTNLPFCLASIPTDFPPPCHLIFAHGHKRRDRSDS